jgi:hypothetical protein
MADTSFADIRSAFTGLREVLGLPASAQGPDDARSAGDRGPDPMRELDDAIAEAQACASWYSDAREWQRISRISDAARALLAAIWEAAGDYWAEIRRDIRVRGFARIVTARTCLAVAGAASALAGEFERAGRQQSRPWKAAHGLDRAATTFADRLMHYHYHPSADGERMRDVARIVTDLDRRPQHVHPHSTVHGNGARTHPGRAVNPSSLARSSFPAAPSLVATASRTAPPTPNSPAGSATATRQTRRVHR